MLCMGLAGESGELIDLLKKHIFHGHPLDEEKVAKELGDIQWYWANMCTELGFSASAIMEANIEKLRARYPQGFSSADSLARRDKHDDKLRQMSKTLAKDAAALKNQ
jgi:NTP pyrophosphatase (non-canonical NTP hydrolase)